MAKLPNAPVPKKLMRAFDALVGGFTIGERAAEGERWQAAGVAAMLLFPLLWRKRLGALALAAAAALLSYYFFDELHEREAIVEPVQVPADPSLN